MADLAITAIGRDQPGIVASVTKVLLDAGCNLSDCSMTRLSDQFAMILLVQSPPKTHSDQLQQALRSTAERLDLTFQVRETQHSAGAEKARPYVASLYGADKPGIVNKVAAQLAAEEVNITNLVSHMVGEGLYMVILELDLPESVNPAELETNLAGLAREMGVELSLRAAQAVEL